MANSLLARGRITSLCPSPPGLYADFCLFDPEGEVSEIVNLAVLALAIVDLDEPDMGGERQHIVGIVCEPPIDGVLSLVEDLEVVDHYVLDGYRLLPPPADVPDHSHRTG